MKQFVSDTQISEHLLHCVSVVVVAKQADDIRRATPSQQISCNLGRSSHYIVGTGDTDHWYGGFGRNPFHVPYMVSIQPVSYTHLDVFKRQVIGQAGGAANH